MWLAAVGRFVSMLAISLSKRDFTYWFSIYFAISAPTIVIRSYELLQKTGATLDFAAAQLSDWCELLSASGTLGDLYVMVLQEDTVSSIRALWLMHSALFFSKVCLRTWNHRHCIITRHKPRHALLLQGLPVLLARRPHARAAPAQAGRRVQHGRPVGGSGHVRGDQPRLEPQQQQSVLGGEQNQSRVHARPARV